MWEILTSIFAVIIENDRIVEVRATSMEELAAWADQQQLEPHADESELEKAEGGAK
jgi:hypothetical protein